MQFDAPHIPDGTSLEALSAIGGRHDGERWTFPLRDEYGRVVDMVTLDTNELPVADEGEAQGLVYVQLPHAAGREADCPVYLVRSPLDVAAIMLLGQHAVGMPNTPEGCELACRLLSGTHVCVVAGNRPGDGMQEGRQLQARLAETGSFASVGIVATPGRTPSVRAWAADGLKPSELKGRVRRTAPDRFDSVSPSREEPSGIEFAFVPISALGPATEPDWLWNGYIAREAITLFTGFWKAGKTTLFAHLLRDLYRGGGLVEFPIDAPTLVISEEPSGLWAERREVLGIPDAVRFLRRDSFARLDRSGWRRLIDTTVREVRKVGAAMVVFDTLPNSWFVTNENDASEVLEALAPMRGISSAGAALLLMHHPRKSDGAEATATRGSGAVPGFVDIILELRRANPDDEKDRRRLLRAYGRYNVPPEVVAELTPGVGYTILGDKAAVRDRDFDGTLVQLIRVADDWAAEDFRENWPTEPKPGVHRLRGHLNQAHKDGKCDRTGRGVRGDPFRYRARPQADSIPEDPPPRGETETESPPEGGSDIPY